MQLKAYLSGGRGGNAVTTLRHHHNSKPHVFRNILGGPQFVTSIGNRVARSHNHQPVSRDLRSTYLFYRTIIIEMVCSVCPTVTVSLANKFLCLVCALHSSSSHSATFKPLQKGINLTVDSWQPEVPVKQCNLVNRGCIKMCVQVSFLPPPQCGEGIKRG